MNAVLIAAAIVAAIGAGCAIILVLAAKFFAVPANETYTKVRECLPGVNCGACGYAGCDGYAAALADGSEKKSGLCIPGSDVTAQSIAEILGLEVEDVVEQVAVVHCLGNCSNTSNKMDYVGIESCKAAGLMFGGQGKCTYGCMGFGDCAAVCPNDAVCIQDGIAHINTKKCIGCGMCARACPRGLITLVRDVERVAIFCNNEEKGGVVRGKCAAGCIGCKKCEKSCESGAIKVENNLARIDYEKCTRCGKCAAACPVGCIVEADFGGVYRA